MKIKILFFAMLLAVSTSALAGGDEPVMAVVSIKGSEIFKVIYKGAGSGKVRLYIYDPSGRKIHSESISGLSGFICPVNFKGLAPGKYMIEVQSADGRYREEVTYQKSNFDLKSIHVSKLLGAEGKFLLAVANAQNEPLYVTIFEKSQRIIHSERKHLTGDFAQLYILPDPYGHYTFEISDEAGNKKHFSF